MLKTNRDLQYFGDLEEKDTKMSQEIEDENMPNIKCKLCSYKLTFEEGSKGYCEQCGTYDEDDISLLKYLFVEYKQSLMKLASKAAKEGYKDMASYQNEQQLIRDTLIQKVTHLLS